MAYCVESDLMVGTIPADTGLKNQYIGAASDEIDSYLATWYVTPISVQMDGGNPPAPVNPKHRVTLLVLKRICSQLASGRLITSMATGGEDTEVHAYGYLLINQALESLRQLATGSPDLPGATKQDNSEGGGVSESDLRGKVFNGDLYSEVDAFYGQTAPGGFFGASPVTG